MPGMITTTIVNAPGCHYCEDAEQVLDRLAEAYPIEIQRLDINSRRGQELIVEHRVGMNPLILVDGEYFSSGRLPRGKLSRLLENRIAATERSPQAPAAPAQAAPAPGPYATGAFTGRITGFGLAEPTATG